MALMTDSEMSGIVQLNRQTQGVSSNRQTQGAYSSRQTQGAYSNRHLDSISTKLANLEQRLSTDTKPHESPTRRPRPGNIAAFSVTGATESIVAGNVSSDLSPRRVGSHSSPAALSSRKYSSDNQFHKRNEQYGSKDKIKKELFTSSFNDTSAHNQHELSQDIAKLEDVQDIMDRIISPINNRITYEHGDVKHISSSPVSDQLSNGFHDNGRHNESLESMKTEALLSIKPHVSSGSLDSGIVFQQGVVQQRSAYVPDSSLLTENQILRDSLDRERYRRKHCEEQISELQSKLLESQQQLAVAVSTDRKKDIMVQQLDKTLAKVVDGWKKNEEEKVAVIEKMKEEKDAAEKLQDRQKQLLATFEKDLSQAVDQLSKEQKRALAIEKEKQVEIQSLKEHKEASLQLVQEEKRKRQATEEMKEDLFKQIKDLQDTISKERDSTLEKQHKLQKELLMMSEKHQRELESEQDSCASVLAKSTEAEEKVKSMRTEITELKEQLQDHEQEKENLRLEVEMQAAKFEASQLRQQTEQQTEVEKTVGQRMKEHERRTQQEQRNSQDVHRQQVQTLLENHQKEMEAMESKTQEQLQNTTIRWKNVVEDLQQRLDTRSMEMSSLNQRLDVEGGHYIDVIGQFQTQCHNMMQWIQVLRNPDDHKEVQNHNTFQKDGSRTAIVSNLPWTPPKKSRPFVSSSPAIKLTKPLPGSYTSSPTITTKRPTHSGYMQELPVADVHVPDPKARPEVSLGGYTNRVLFTNPALPDARPESLGGYPSSLMFTKPTQPEVRPEVSIGGYPGSSAFTNRTQSEARPEVSIGGYPDRMMFTNTIQSDTSSFKPLNPQYDDQQTSSFLSEHGTVDHIPEKEESVTDLSVGPLESTVIERDTYNALTDKFQKHTEKQQELQHYIQMLLERSPGSPVQSKESESPQDHPTQKSTNAMPVHKGEPSTEILTLDQLSEISKLIHGYQANDRDTVAKQPPTTPDQMMTYLKTMQSRVASVQQKQQLNRPTNQVSGTSHMTKTSVAVIKDKPSMDFNSIGPTDNTATRTSKSKTASGPEAKMRTRNQRCSVPQPAKPSQKSRKTIWK